MTISQLLRIFLARYKLGLSIFLAIVTLGVVASLLWPKKYTASASVVVDVKSPDPIQGMVYPALMSPSYMATQIDVIRSEEVGRRVVTALQLDKSPELQDQWREATDGKGSLVDWLAKSFGEDLDVRPSRESNVISINYTSRDANFSYAMVSAVVRAYLEMTSEMRTNPARQYNTFFDQRAQQLRQQLDAAQQRLTEYNNKRGLISSDQFDVEDARLNQLAAQLVALEAESANSASRQAAAAKKAAEIQDVMTSPVIAQLKTLIATQDAKLQELRAKYGPNHPEVLNLNASTGELRAKMDAEIARITGSVQVANSVNQARQAEVRAAYEAQRQRVLKLKNERDAAAALVRDVENAQRAYDLVLTRVTETGLQSHSNLTNVSLLTPPVVPGQPSSPKVLLNTMLAIVVGGLLGVTAMLLAELLDRRLRSPEDVLDGLHLPLLGVMPASPEGLRKGMLHRLLPSRRTAPALAYAGK
ncbi:MAG: chain length determinant protein EpsF [Burkholderiales bacterium]|nr:chain length determinant protein EpsF [Burkholderiales bacterium]MCH2241573.1 chain length determinant protein EpsF [Aquabacterium sp.]